MSKKHFTPSRAKMNAGSKTYLKEKGNLKFNYNIHMYTYVKLFNYFLRFVPMYNHKCTLHYFVGL